MNHNASALMHALDVAVTKRHSGRKLRRDDGFLEKAGSAMKAFVVHGLWALAMALFVLPLTPSPTDSSKWIWLAFSVGFWSLLEALWIEVKLNGWFVFGNPGGTLRLMPLAGQHVVRHGIGYVIRKSWGFLLRLAVIVICTARISNNTSLISLIFASMLCVFGVFGLAGLMLRFARHLPGKARMGLAVGGLALLASKAIIGKQDPSFLQHSLPFLEWMSKLMPGAGLPTPFADSTTWIGPLLLGFAGFFAWMDLPNYFGKQLDEARDQIVDAHVTDYSSQPTTTITLQLDNEIKTFAKPHPSAGLIEHWVTGVLNPRQRALLKIFGHQDPSWTASLVKFIKQTAVSLATVWILKSTIGPALIESMPLLKKLIAVLVGSTFLAFIIGIHWLLRGLLPADIEVPYIKAWIRDATHGLALGFTLPARPIDLAMTTLKASMIRASAATPVMIGLCFVVAPLFGTPVGKLLPIACALVWAGPACRPGQIASSLDEFTTPTSHPTLYSIIRILILLILGISILGSALLVIMRQKWAITDWPAVILGLTSLHVLCWAFYAFVTSQHQSKRIGWFKDGKLPIR